MVRAVAALPRLAPAAGSGKEIWQFLSPRLRCWVPARADGEGEASLARPYVLLLVSLFPAGRVIAHRVPNPPNVEPSPERVAAFLAEAMVAPPKHTSLSAHRPLQVVFASKPLAASLHRTLESCGVGCGVLSPPPNLPTHLHALAETMCERGMASRGPAAGRPLLLSASGVTRPHVRALAEAGQWVRRVRPWRVLPDRLAVRVRVLGRETTKGGAWALADAFWGPGEAGSGEHDDDDEASAASGGGGKSRSAPALAWHEGTTAAGRGPWRDGKSGTAVLQRAGTEPVPGWGDGFEGGPAGASVRATVMRGPVWAAVMGHTAESEALEAAGRLAAKPAAAAAATGAGDGAKKDDEEEGEDDDLEALARGDGVTLGVAVFKSRWDAEQRLMAAEDEPGAPPAVAEANPVDKRCAWCGRAQGQPGRGAGPGEAGPPAAVRLQRCSRSRAAFYCAGTDCQRRDWVEGGHKRRCLPRKLRTPGARLWGDGEGVTVFVRPEAAPVGDIADMDEAAAEGRAQEAHAGKAAIAAAASASAAAPGDGPAPLDAPVEGPCGVGDRGPVPEPRSVAASGCPMPLVFGDAGPAAPPRRPTEAELTTNTLLLHVLPRWLALWPGLAATALPSAREVLVVLRSDDSLPPLPCLAGTPCEDDAAASLGVEAAPAAAVTAGRVAVPSPPPPLSMRDLMHRLSLPQPPTLPPWLDGLVVAVRLDPMLTPAEAKDARTAKPAEEHE